MLKKGYLMADFFYPGACQIERGFAPVHTVRLAEKSWLKLLFADLL